MPASRPLSPTTRRIVSWLLLLAAALLALGILLQIGVILYVGWQQSFEALNWPQALGLTLGLTTAAVLGYYGWQLRQGSESQ